MKCIIGSICLVLVSFSLWAIAFGRTIEKDLELSKREQRIYNEEFSLNQARDQFALDVERFTMRIGVDRANKLREFARLQEEIRSLPTGIVESMIHQESWFQEKVVRYEPNGLVSRGCAQFVDRYKTWYSNDAEFDSYDCYQSITVLAEWVERQLKLGNSVSDLLMFYNGGHNGKERSQDYAMQVQERMQNR